MTLLVAGLVIFFAVHLVPSLGSTRARLVERLGINAYKGLFALAAAAGLVLIVLGKAYADFVHLWTPPLWSRHLAWTVMPFVFVLLAGSHMPSNLKRFTPHPMLWGVALWAVVHLKANGDLASMLLFGSFLVYALLAIVSLNRRGAQTSTERVPASKDIMLIVAGGVAFLVVLYAHGFLFGVQVV